MGSHRGFVAANCQEDATNDLPSCDCRWKQSQKLVKTLIISICTGFLSIVSSAQLPPVPVFQITSPDFVSGGPIPKLFTVDGTGRSPGSRIDGVPQGAKSLVLIADDPDAPKGTFTHWLVWNLSPDLREIIAGSVPREAREGKNSAGKTGYQPPSPPSGEHRYYFRLYALDAPLSLAPGATRDELEKAMKGHTQKMTEIMGRYARDAAKQDR